MSAITNSPPIPLQQSPFSLFDQWFKEASTTEPGLPEAMSLATATADGRPSVRMVLLKDAGPDGFVFYTNTQSRKGDELAANPFAALCLYWKSVGRQIRIEGRVSHVTETEADAYFASRPRVSQLGAWASDQSRVLSSRDVLVERLREIEGKYQGTDVARPPHWKGYRVAPDVIEFWQDVANRLHDRLVYRRNGDQWQVERLYP
ncbi:MAG: pyridoxamine 5'-phosphate oxidase [Rhodobacteraceae bacterium]|nr:pyridoxamine 5'-phosphate oxidase [Paracoccaceae bacterium]